MPGYDNSNFNQISLFGVISLQISFQKSDICNDIKYKIQIHYNYLQFSVEYKIHLSIRSLLIKKAGQYLNPGSQILFRNVPLNFMLLLSISTCPLSKILLGSWHKIQALARSDHKLVRLPTPRLFLGKVARLSFCHSK